MAESRNFRSALNGFNREDVVRYIESMNTKHTALVNQLKSEKQSLADELDALKTAPAEETVSAAEYTALLQERDELLARLEQLQAEAAEAAHKNIAEEELAAYRRAEQAERAAKERSQQMYRQAAAMLADATVKVGASATLLDTLAGSVTAQLNKLQAAVADSRTTMQETAEAIAAIGIEE
jgi:SMC interacting uncharacterized protein involved in chromosome segregation